MWIFRCLFTGCSFLIEFDFILSCVLQGGWACLRHGISWLWKGGAWNHWVEIGVRRGYSEGSGDWRACSGHGENGYLIKAADAWAIPGSSPPNLFPTTRLHSPSPGRQRVYSRLLPPRHQHHPTSPIPPPHPFQPPVTSTPPPLTLSNPRTNPPPAPKRHENALPRPYSAHPRPQSRSETKRSQRW